VIILLMLGVNLIPFNEPVQSQPTSRGQWRYVGGSGPGNYSAIQDAINASDNGDTVFVYNGTYHEYIIFNKTIDLFGQDKHATILVGYFAYTLCFNIDGVTMSGFTIALNLSRGEGIRIDTNNNTFTDNIIDMTGDRIRIKGDHNIVSNNSITDCYLFLMGSNNTVCDNAISNDDYGIYLADCRDNTLSRNQMTDCGLLIAGDLTLNNTLTDNIVNGRPLAYLHDTSGLVIGGEAGQVVLAHCTEVMVKNQVITHTTVGIQLWKSDSCIITDNTFSDNDVDININGNTNIISNNTITQSPHGIVLTGHNNTMATNVISDNEQGIYISLSNRDFITTNTLTNNDYGILANYGAESITIDSNIFSSNTYAVTCLSGSRDCYLADNTMTGNYIGVNLSYSKANTIINNTLLNNQYAIQEFSGTQNTLLTRNSISHNDNGIQVLGSDHSTITNNTISKNKETGISIADSTNTTINTNVISSNNGDGVRLSSSNATIKANTFLNDTNGVRIIDCKETLIQGNRLLRNKETSITLTGTCNATIARNMMIGNQIGVYLLSSFNNSISQNTFLRNHRHAFFENCTNLWDGNFWQRPRLLPKIILGRGASPDGGMSLVIDIDHHPTLMPNRTT
jgi:parallel beta-helix repeat protein